MKKLLLKFAALALFALSPHTPEASAQTSTGHMDFEPCTADHNADMYMYKGLQQTVNSKTYTLGAKEQWFGESQIDAYGYFTATSDYNGLGRIENSDILLDFNYENLLVSATNSVTNRTYRYNTFSLSPRFANDIGSGLYMYAGTKMLIKSNNPQKVIKKIVLKTPIESANVSNIQYQKNFNIYDSFESTTRTDKANVSYSTYSGKNASGTAATCVQLTIEATTLFGLDELVIAVPQTGTHITTVPQYAYSEYGSTEITSSNLVLARNANVSTSTSNYQIIKQSFGNRFSFAISSIDIEYIDKDDIPPYLASYGGYASEVEHWNETTSAWERPTAETIYNGDVEKLRMGNVIAEFTKPTTFGTGASAATQATVTVNPALGRIGMHRDVKVRAYLDKYPMYKGAETKPLMITYEKYGLDADSKYSLASWYSYWLNPITSTQGTNMIIAGYQQTTQPVIAKLTNRHGIEDDLYLYSKSTINTFMDYMVNVKTGNNDIKSGAKAFIWFDNIVVSVASESSATPLRPHLSDPVRADRDASGAWIFNGNTSVTVSLDDYNYPETEFYYMFGNAPIADGAFDITKAKKTDGSIVITEDDLKTGTVLSAVAVATVDGKQKIGQVQSMTFKSAGITAKFTNYKDLNKAENDGKIVSLDFTINVFAAAYGSGTGNDNKNFYIYGWDYDHNPIKIVDMENAASSKRTKLHKISKPGGPSNETKDKLMMLEASHIVGKFFYNNGHPEIRIADMRADAPEQYDYTSYLPTEYTTGDSEVFADKDLLKIFPMDVEYAREFSPALYGKEIRIRPATCTEVVTAKKEYKFKLGDKEFKMQRSLSTDYCLATPADFIADEEYSIRGFFDYDGTDYVFVPYKAVFAVQTPKPEDIVIKDSDGNTIEHYATTAEGVDLEVMMSLYVKKITFELPAAYISDAAKKDTYKNGKSLFLNSAGSNLNNAAQVSLANVRTINLTSMPTFEEGTDYGDIKLVITNLYNAVSFTEDVSDTIVIRVHDKVCTAPAFGSFAELRKAVKDDPSLVGEFVRVTSPNIAVAAINNNKISTATAYKNEINSLLLKDISPLKEGKDADDLECLPVTTTDLLNKYKVSYNDYRGNNLWQRYTRDVRVGDSIGSVTFVVKLDDNGNLIGDMTNLSDQNYFKSGAWNSYRSDTPNYQQAANPNYQSGTARFSHLVEQMNRVITVEKPAETTLGEAQTERMVTLSDVAIVNTAADGEPAVYAAVTANQVPLSWSLFKNAEYKTANANMIGSLGEGATYNITGLLRPDGKGGHAMDVYTLDPAFAKTFAICNHPKHDTYIANQIISDELVGKPISIRGANLSREGTTSATYVFSAELAESLKIDFTTMAAKKSTWTSTLNSDLDVAAAGETKRVSKSYYNITGLLLKSEDGEYSIDIYTFEKITGTAIKTSIFANGTSVVASAFYGHSFPNITAVTDGGVPTKGAEKYKFYYTAVEAPSDVVRARKEAGETLEEIATDLLKDAEEKEYDPENRPEFTESYFMSAYSCTPGDVAPAAIAYRYIEKSSLTTGTLADLVEATHSYTYINSGTVSTDNYYISSPLRVVEVNPAYGYIALTDGEKIIGARRGATITTGIKADDYINDLGMYRKWHKNFYHITSEVEYLTPADAPATEIKVPEAVVLGADLAAEAGTMVKIPVARISKVDGEYMVSYADDAAMPVALADNAEADASAPVALPLTSHLGWNPDDIDETAEYIVHGVAINRTTLTDPNKPAYDSDGNSIPEASPETGKLEIWALSVELRGQTPAPVITVTGAESVEGNKAVTIEDVTVSIACEEETAKIEYSTDGGNTWTAYDDTKPVVIKNSTTVAARAQGEDMSMSATVTMEIVRETVSGKAAIDFAPKAGYTEVTLRHEAIDFAGKYEVRYTTDGSEPTADSQLYTAPLELEEACTVKAILKEEGKDRFGAAVSEAVSVRSGDLKITATRAPGKTTVRIEVADTKHFNADGAVIFYSKNDGATYEEYQVAGGKNYVEFDTDKAITVVAYLEEQGKTTGEDVAEDITVDPVTTDPTDPTDPTPAKSGKVVITTTEGDGVTYVELAPESQLAAGSYAIHYTLDGTEPTAASTKHDGNRIEVRKACTIKAVLIENGKTAGEVAVKQIAVTGIDGIAADGSANVTVEGDCIIAPEGSMVFDMTGRRVRPEGLRAGIYIVRLADGTAVKVAVR